MVPLRRLKLELERVGVSSDRKEEEGSARWAVRDSGISLLDELQLRLLEVHAMREDRIPTQEVELVVDGGVGFRRREERCRRRVSPSSRR